MAGGYSVLKDAYKIDRLRAVEWRNGNRPAAALGPDGPVMPERVITKPPIAELRPDQKDEDSLPPYSVLDRILEAWSSRNCRSPRSPPRPATDEALVARHRAQAAARRI